MQLLVRFPGLFEGRQRTPETFNGRLTGRGGIWAALLGPSQERRRRHATPFSNATPTFYAHPSLPGPVCGPRACYREVAGVTGHAKLGLSGTAR